MVIALLWATCFLLLCHPNMCLGFPKSSAAQWSRLHTRSFHSRPNVHIYGTKSNGADITANSEIGQRKELWKSISSLERQAVKLLIAGKEGTADEDSTKVSEAFKLLSQSAAMKATDPFLVLATRYASALEKKDTAECEKILKEMKSVGVPPHIASLVTKQQPASTGMELHNNNADLSGEYKMEEVDAGSTFSDTVTDKIRVKVNSFYDSEKSDPANGKYMFTYKVAIFNEGSEAVQVVARMWEIEMFRGVKDVVRGAGITGKQPIIAPGDVYNYESSCPLKIFPPRGKRLLGTMGGAYTMCKGNMGQHNFTAKIGKFNLILPESVAAP